MYVDHVCFVNMSGKVGMKSFRLTFPVMLLIKFNSFYTFSEPDGQIKYHTVNCSIYDIKLETIIRL